MPLNKDFKVKDSLFVGNSANIVGNINTQGSILSGGVNLLTLFSAAATMQSLTGGDGITGFSYNGTTPQSISVDNTVVRTSGAQTISGIKTFTDNIIGNGTINIAGAGIINGRNIGNDGIKLDSTTSNVQSNSATTWNYQGTDLKSLSSNWQNTYTTVQANSATWNYQGTDLKSLSSNWQSTYTTVQANSATLWNYQGTDLKALSGNWQSTYTTVQANSATLWNYQGTDLKALSGNWQSTYTNVQANSATTWNYQGADLKALSGNWQGTYTTVQANSATWNYQGTDLKALSGNWQSTYTTVQANSATLWNYQGTDLKALSGNWQNTYTTVQSNSANFLSSIESVSQGQVRSRNVAGTERQLITIDNLGTNGTPTFAGQTINGNITITGTVDGRDVSNDGTKLDQIATTFGGNSARFFTSVVNLLQGSVAFSGLTGTNVTLNLTNLGTTGTPTFATLSSTGSATLNGNVIIGDTSARALTINAGTITLPNATSAGNAIVLGGDVNIYRSAADVLRTDDSLSVGGNATIAGSLSVLGDFTYLNTTVSVTSALSVINVGTGPALYIEQDGVQPIAHFVDRNGGSIVFSDTGSIGVGTPLNTVPPEKVSVVGNISASGTMKLGSLATGATNNTIIENSGTLQRREINGDVWNTGDPIAFRSGITTPNVIAKFDSSSRLTTSSITDGSGVITLSSDVVIPLANTLIRNQTGSVNTRSRVFTGTLTTGSNTVVTFTKNNLLTAKYTVTLASGSLRTSFEILANYNGTSGCGTVYAIIDSQSTSLLADVDVDTSGSSFDLSIDVSSTCNYIIDGNAHYQGPP
jgi:hypothetical protein